MKLIWRVAPEPTGRYRSFDRRGWPSAHYKGPKENVAAQILCPHDYRPSDVREGRHAELKIGIAFWRDHTNGRQTFDWKYLVRRAKTLDEAKKLAEDFITRHPEVMPKEF